MMTSSHIPERINDSRRILPPATIHAFALDTIHGVNYKFTIDQLGPDGVGLIYNQDSLPVGSDTIIDRILIKTLTTTSGIITAKNAEGQDTLFNYYDSIDFRGTMQKPMRIKVWAADMQYTKEYTISVRVHLRMICMQSYSMYRSRDLHSG